MKSKKKFTVRRPDRQTVVRPLSSLVGSCGRDPGQRQADGLDGLPGLRAPNVIGSPGVPTSFQLMPTFGHDQHPELSIFRALPAISLKWRNS